MVLGDYRDTGTVTTETKKQVALSLLPDLYWRDLIKRTSAEAKTGLFVVLFSVLGGGAISGREAGGETRACYQAVWVTLVRATRSTPWSEHKSTPPSYQAALNMANECWMKD